MFISLYLIAYHIYKLKIKKNWGKKKLFFNTQSNKKVLTTEMRNNL